MAKFLFFSLANGEVPHFVITGVVIRYNNKTYKFYDQTSVFMKKLTEEEILSYVATGESMWVKNIF